MRSVSKLWFLVLCMTLCAVAPAQQKINAVTGINWPPITGAGTPASHAVACTTANYGQPYQDTSLTPNIYYTCGTDGWAVRTGPPGPQGPAGTANAVGPNGTLQMSLGAGAFGAAVPYTNYAPANARVQANGTTTYGDSTVNGTGASTPQFIFGSLIGQDVPGPYVNWGFGGLTSAGIADVAWSTWAPVNLTSLPFVTYESGINDANNTGTNAAAVVNFNLSNNAGIRHILFPLANQLMASTQTASGGWSAISSWAGFSLPTLYGTTTPVLNGTGLTTTTSGSTVTFTLPAAAKVGFSYLAYAAGTGTFTATLNGSALTSQCTGSTTFAAFGCGSAPNADTIFAEEFSGNPASTNTLVIASTNTGTVSIIDADTVPITTANEPVVAIQGVLRQAADGAAAATALYNTAIQNTANAFLAENQNVVFVNVRTGTPGVNTTTDFGGTGCAGGVPALHPADCGYVHLAQTYENALLAAGYTFLNIGAGRNSGPVNYPPRTGAIQAASDFSNDWQLNPDGIQTSRMPGLCLFTNSPLTVRTLCNGRISFSFSTPANSFATKIGGQFMCLAVQSSSDDGSDTCPYLLIDGSLGAYFSHILHLGTTLAGGASSIGLSYDDQVAGFFENSVAFLQTTAGTLPVCAGSGVQGRTRFINDNTGTNNITFSANTGAGDTINGASSVTFNNVAQYEQFDAQCSLTVGSSKWNISRFNTVAVGAVVGGASFTDTEASCTITYTNGIATAHTGAGCP